MINNLELSLDKIEKQGFDHYMLRKSMQTKAIRDTLRGRIIAEKGVIKLSGVDDYVISLSAKKITIIACGTSWHSALVAEYMFEKIAKNSC